MHDRLAGLRCHPADAVGRRSGAGRIRRLPAGQSAGGRLPGRSRHDGGTGFRSPNPIWPAAGPLAVEIPIGNYELHLRKLGYVERGRDGLDPARKRGPGASPADRAAWPGLRYGDGCRKRRGIVHAGRGLPGGTPARSSRTSGARAKGAPTRCRRCPISSTTSRSRRWATRHGRCVLSSMRRPRPWTSRSSRRRAGCFWSTRGG